ncbi:potassium channel family protein [Intrasporangium calvum]|uniref:TrkA-N domain protein n=1 Tax=Intrasporangium calvum (strain ATCC 23552 / DSM 43043 / JCM 3097 / NBRC 12989 / NCIMB 10167 / NRRL B-3866 / 7 KIP) TaxID=710696 RepID=E6SA00_INTC7|nr:TrkA family potassium uptake protein [Intrasporangium calvum]ADU47190.1 TrkA-N domain protein [Intrasporangium calvum DSM 43043]
MARNKLFEDDVLVIGLGRFGSAVAMELTKLGHRVIAVERNNALAESYVNKFAKVVHADMAQASAIDMIRAAEPKIAVVGIGSSVESSVLASANLVDAGVPSIWAKALSQEHKRILDRIGVHHVISPESDAGRRVAHLVNGRLLDYIEFDDGFAIVKIKPPSETIGFTLEQSQIRRKYGVTVVGVKAPGEDFTYAVPQTKVSAHHMLIVSGPTELIERFAARP